MTTSLNVARSAWWKLLLAAPCLIGLMIVGSGLGVQAWFLGIFIVLLAAGCAAAGIVLGLVELFRPSGAVRG